MDASPLVDVPAITEEIVAVPTADRAVSLIGNPIARLLG